MAKANAPAAPAGPPTAAQRWASAPGAMHKADVDGDGTPTSSFEQASAERAGKRKKVEAAGAEARKAALAAKKKPKEIEKDVADAKKKAKAEGLTDAEKAQALKDWKHSVIESLENAKAGELIRSKGPSLSQGQADAFHSVAQALQGKLPGTTSWESQTGDGPDQLESVLNGEVKSNGLEAFAGTKTGYNQYKRPMWNYLYRKGLAYEGDWQIETTVSYVNKAGKKVSADATKIPYFVTDGKTVPPGTWAKITAPNGNSIYARALDSNGVKADPFGEISVGAWKMLGYPDAAPDNAPADQVKVKTFPGSAGTPVRDVDGNLSYEDAYLSPQEIQEGGALIDSGKVKSIGDRADLYRAQGKEPPAREVSDPDKWSKEHHDKDVIKKKEEEKKKADEKKADDKKADDKKKKDKKGKDKKVGMRLLEGYPTVAIGPEQRLVGYASVASLHEGGGHVNQGSSTVFVGKFPFARIGDGTSDDLAVVSGAETVFVGGSTTTMA